MKAHQAQFKGQAVAFKKHVSEVCSVLQNSSASKAEYVSAAAKYGLNEKLAGRMSITNLSTFICLTIISQPISSQALCLFQTQLSLGSMCHWLSCDFHAAVS